MPETFNEKLNLLKLSTLPNQASIVADKVAVRDYVENKINSDALIPVIGTYQSADDIDLAKLPNKFAIKVNHGSGWNLICLDKTSLDWNREKKKLNRWLKMNAYYLSREKQYRHIFPKLIVETLIDENPRDFKFFCVNGKVRIVQVDSDRFVQHTRNFYTPDWRPVHFEYVYPPSKNVMKEPTNLERMISTAEMLASNFSFIRIDLYSVEEKIFFGEITLFPEGGSGPFRTKAMDREFAKYIGLN